MVKQTDVELGDGRRLHAYDCGDVGTADRIAVFWQHGTTNIGAPPQPLFSAAARLGIRWGSYDRRGYGGSTARPGRDVASAADDVAAIAEALCIDRFAIMGHSGGGPHALACGARLPDRVLGVVCVSGTAPYGADGLDWFAGMADAGVASMSAAAEGRAARQAYEESTDDLDFGFTPEDEAALGGAWSWLLDVVRPALAAGPEATIDDDLASVAPWGFEPARVAVSTMFLHGGRDRVVPSRHSEWLAGRIPSAQLRLYPNDGHITVLSHASAAMEWLRDHADRP